MRGARRRLRDMIVSGGAGADLGTVQEVISTLANHHPEVKPSTLKNYVEDAGDGSLGNLGDFRLVQEGDRLKVVKIGGGGADPKAIQELRAEVAALRTQVGSTVKEILVKHEAKEFKPLKLKVKGPLPVIFEKLVKLASIRQNVLMVGPAGCGKTYLAGKVAEALKLPFAFVSCSAGMSEGQLAGRLLPVKAGGAFAYVPAPFVDLYETGGVFLFDEVDSSDANTLTFINAAIANGHLALPQRPDKPVAERHPDFVCIAAANTFGHGASRIYAGRNQLDGATLDRFRAGMVIVDYDPTVEEALVDPKVLTWGRKIRAKIERLGLRRIMSTRVLRDFTIQKRELGFGVAEWEDSYFADWTSDDKAKL